MLATQAGSDIQELIEFVQQFAEQSIRAFRNGLTFEDNVRCSINNVVLKHGVEQLINVTGETIGIIPTRVMNSTDRTTGVVTNESITNFFWYFNNSGQLTVKANFASAVPDRSIQVRLIVLLA